MAVYRGVREFIDDGSAGLFTSYNNNFEFKRGIIESYDKNLDLEYNFGSGHAEFNKKLEVISLSIEKSGAALYLKNITRIEYDIRKSADITIYFGDEGACKLFL